MRLTIQQEDLASALAVVQRAVSGRSTLPILTGIMLETTDAGLQLTATDLEVAIRTSVPAMVETSGALVLPARYFSDIVRRMPSSQIQFEADPVRHIATLRFGKAEFTIHGYSVDSFPEFPKPADEPVLGNSNVQVDQDRLKKALRETLFSVSADETRPILTGVQCSFFADGIRAVSTDGFRVALSEQGDCSGEPVVQAIVPGRSLQELNRLLQAGGPHIQLALVENQLYAELSHTHFSARLLEGVFPTVLDLLPKEYPFSLKLERSTFQEACERVGLISEAKDRGNSIRLTLGPSEIELRANAPEVGTAFESLPCSFVAEDESLEIAFNARYLVDGLRILEDDEVNMEFSGPETAARVVSSADSSRLVYTILPMRTR